MITKFSLFCPCCDCFPIFLTSQLTVDLTPWSHPIQNDDVQIEEEEEEEEAEEDFLSDHLIQIGCMELQDQNCSLPLAFFSMSTINSYDM